MGGDLHHRVVAPGPQRPEPRTLVPDHVRPVVQQGSGPVRQRIGGDVDVPGNSLAESQVPDDAADQVERESRSRKPGREVADQLVDPASKPRCYQLHRGEGIGAGDSGPRTSSGGLAPGPPTPPIGFRSRHVGARVGFLAT